MCIQQMLIITPIFRLNAQNILKILVAEPLALFDFSKLKISLITIFQGFIFKRL